jgi:molecular chaperone DnaK (HSP70)
MAYVPANQPSSDVHLFDIPQWVGDQLWSSLPQLASMWFMRYSQEPPFTALPFAWQEDALVGSWARQLGEKNPLKLISSAKSWLSQSSVDAQTQRLPLSADAGLQQRTPYQITCGLLAYLQAAWDAEFPQAPLHQQAVVITLPASFHPGARELTAQAAQSLGLSQLTLLEEPQAAAYHWLWQHPDWRQQLTAGDRILVVDVGGGTSDFALIDVTDQQGELQLQRVAVGEHILLGGDNMDLALAYALKAQLEQQGQTLKSWQLQALMPACRSAKETLFTHDDLAQVSVVVPSRGSSLFANSLTAVLTQQMLHDVIINGFFPIVALHDQPVNDSTQALRGEGLPYAQDAAISKHLAAFLQPHAQQFPNKILLNGGVFKALPLVQRLQTILLEWLQSQSQKSQQSQVVAESSALNVGRELQLLSGTDYDLAVAKGAAYYGALRATSALRIRSGIAHSYYIGIETPGLAIPGMKPAMQSICVAPFGLEEGTLINEHTDPTLAALTLQLQVGRVVQFQFFSSRLRTSDAAGLRLDEDDTSDLQPLPPLTVALPATAEHGLGSRVAVRLAVAITEMGTLEIHAHAVDGSGHWQVALNVRQENVRQENVRQENVPQE